MPNYRYVAQDSPDHPAPLTLSVVDTGVDRGVGQVDQQVDQDEGTATTRTVPWIAG